MGNLGNLGNYQKFDITLPRIIESDDRFANHFESDLKYLQELQANITCKVTCEGGDVWTGDRIYKAIQKYPFETTAEVIGVAASMGALALGAFDRVKIDKDAWVMLHRLRVGGVSDPKEMIPEHAKIYENFNKMACERLKEKGGNADFLDEVFEKGANKNYWLTADEAEAMGLGIVFDAGLAPTKIKPHEYEVFANQFLTLETMNFYNKFFNKNENDGEDSSFFIHKSMSGKNIISPQEELAVNSVIAIEGAKKPFTGIIQIENSNIMIENNVIKCINEVEKDKDFMEDEKKAKKTNEKGEDYDKQIADLERQIANLKSKKTVKENPFEKEKENIENTEVLDIVAKLTQQLASMSAKFDSLRKAPIGQETPQNDPINHFENIERVISEAEAEAGVSDNEAYHARLKRMTSGMGVEKVIETN